MNIKKKKKKTTTTSQPLPTLVSLNRKGLSVGHVAAAEDADFGGQLLRLALADVQWCFDHFCGRLVILELNLDFWGLIFWSFWETSFFQSSNWIFWVNFLKLWCFLKFEQLWDDKWLSVGENKLRHTKSSNDIWLALGRKSPFAGGFNIKGEESSDKNPAVMAKIQWPLWDKHKGNQKSNRIWYITRCPSWASFLGFNFQVLDTSELFRDVICLCKLSQPAKTAVVLLLEPLIWGRKSKTQADVSSFDPCMSRGQNNNTKSKFWHDYIEWVVSCWLWRWCTTNLHPKSIIHAQIHCVSPFSCLLLDRDQEIQVASSRNTWCKLSQ